jgi:hypothetical protein
MEFGSEIVGKKATRQHRQKLVLFCICVGDDLAIETCVGGTKERRHHGGFRGGSKFRVIRQ